MHAVVVGDVESRSATARPSARAASSASRRPGPASVNTDSVVVGVARARRAATRRTRPRARRASRRRGPPTRSGRTRAREQGTTAPIGSGSRCVLGLALPQFDYSVAGESPLRWDTIVEYATRGERAGFESLWLCDHLFLSVAKYGGPPDASVGGFEPRRHARRARARRQPSRLGTLVICEALRPASVLAKALASLDRDRGRSARRRSRRGLVRARVRRDRHGRCRPPAFGSRGCATRSIVVPRAARRAARSRTRARTTAPWTRATDPHRVQRPTPADHRRREGRPVAPASSPSSPTGGTRAGRGRSTTYRERVLVLERACERRRPRSGDGVAARSVSTRCAARTRPISRAGSSGWPRLTPRGVLDGVTLDAVAGGTARRHRRAGAASRSRGGRSSASTRS